MLDPIGAFERIRNYIFRYLDTAFRIDNPNVTKERHQLLQEEGTLSAEPQIEPIPKYKQAIYLQELLEEKYAHTLHNFSQEERQAFVELALAGLFPKKEKTLEAIYPIYTHQLQMLERGTKPGHPAIVTSGTGSGKTESFLLPIIATLSQEGKRKWSQCSPPQYKNNWWERDTFQFYREGEDTKRQAAVRVLLLYPMNALVEDQLARLREAIDSPEAHQVMDKHFNGHRIFIGRYTGKTPVTNFLDHPRPPDKWEQKRERKIEQLREAMNGFTRDRHEATLHDEQKVEDGEEDPKARYLFPSTKTGELCSRWDMQQYPPDILITNLSMLNGMLMREVENAILEKTRSWLQSNDDAYFFLVIDELHLQRGSAGTEVFYLLRLLLERLGLLEEEHRHKLRILSSSASLPTEGEGQTKSATYLWDAFGKLGSYPGRKEQAHFNQEEDWLQAIIPGEPIPFNPTCQETLPTLPFCALRELYYDSKAELALYSSQDDKEAWLQIAQAFNLPQKGDLASTVTLILEECGRRIYAECYDESNPTSLRATKLSTLAQRIFGGVDKEKLEALKGLLFIHGFADVYKHRFPRHSKPEGLPSFRVHTFFRALEGMFAPVGGNAYSVDKQTYKKYFSADAEKQSDVPLPTGTPSRNIGQLSIEPGAAIVEAIIEQTEHKSRQLNRFRQLPLLYCECCGELFIGGQRGEHQNGMLVEFLPSEVDLSKLPDSPVSPFFYTNSYKQAAIFWPTQIDLESLEEIVSDAEATNTGWVRAVFNPHAAVARILDFGEEASETGSWVSGYLFVRDENENDRHDRSNAKGGTALPYSCPRCASDYGNRPLTRQQTRLSPIRGFTTGLAMMTRLLASELYSILYRYSVHQAPKLISFSDSRQDAAKTAFNIASYHNSDAIRIAFIELLLNNQIDLQKKIRALPDLKEKMIALKKHKRSIEDSRDELEYEEGDSQQLAKLNSELRSVEEEQKKLKQEYDSIRNAQDNLISLEHIIEPSDEKLYHGQQELRIDLRPLTKRLIDLGINPANISSRNDLTININEPIDDEGREVNNQYDFGWHDIFNIVAGEVHDWKDDPNDESKQKRLDKARTKIAQGVRSHIGDALFRSNYFSLEAMGVGYPTLQGKLKSEHADMLGEFDALIRVMADRYWVDSGRWAKYSPGHQADLPFTGEDEILSTLQEAHRWSRRNRIRQYAEARWGENWQQELAQCIKVLWGDYGHKGGVVRMDALHLRLVTIKDRCWRCNNCKRIHLHVGSGICTRCFSTLPEEANESVRNIREDNYLTAQLERDGKPFRIRCEELTGQTDDPADRQKRFKDIIIGDYDDGHPKFRPRESIDMLAVTTTMEVGIDVGQLQAIFQANMPPTRFNYQQRVGRAGRRNQAFSFILTLCRSRSHDLHYFRHAEQITGSPPPPPFLTKTQPQIAKRLLHKGWLREVFERLKEPYTKSHQTYPADEMSPPDFHGEFLPKGFLTNRNSPLHPGQPWAELVKSTLQNSIGERDRLTSHLLQDSDLETETQSVATDPDDLYEEIVNIDRQSNAPGLAQNIAEYGLMPMYGMPTRVRNLYHGTKLLGQGNQARFNFTIIDRDLELAIYEFAPGNQLLKDHQGIQCVGFTGDLSPFWSWQTINSKVGTTYNENFQNPEAYQEKRWLLQCESCGTWTQFVEEPSDNELSCGYCESLLHSEEAKLCVVPTAFCSDFKHTKVTPATELRNQSHVSQAEDQPPTLALEPHTNLRSAMISGVRTFKVNPGIDKEGFTAERRERKLRLKNYQGQYRSYKLEHQHILESLTERGSTTPIASPSEFKNAWLLAPKVTDALFLAPQSIPSGLRLISDEQIDQPLRTALISALHLFTDRAALTLDIDPDEFEKIEPRVYIDPDTQQRFPLLQFTDRLLNGAGYCVNLYSLGVSKLKIVEILQDILDERNNETQLLLSHRKRCESSCYNCMQRYGNRQYHGLLDWRLGMAVLRCLLDSTFSCGLDGNFAYPEILDWGEQVKGGLQQLQALFDDDEIESTLHNLDGFHWIEMNSCIGFVVHPLWDKDDLGDSRCFEIYEELTQKKHVQLINSFRLTRRPFLVRKELRSLT